MSRLLLSAVSVVCGYVAIKAGTKIVDSYLENRPYAGLKVVYTAKTEKDVKTA